MPDVLIRERRVEMTQISCFPSQIVVPIQKLSRIQKHVKGPGSITVTSKDGLFELDLYFRYTKHNSDRTRH